MSFGYAADALFVEIELARLEVYELLDEIERHCGVDFDIPRAITQDDFDAIGTAAAVIRTGAGTATFEGGEAMVAAADIPGVAERTRGSHITRPVVYPIFGQDVVLGLGEYVLPPVRVVEVIPHGTRPDSPARVKFVADGDGQMTFRLIDPSGESPAGASA